MHCALILTLQAYLVLVPNETGLDAAYPVVVVVDASEETRVRRLVDSRGMTEEQVRARSAAQAGRERRLAAADFVVPNDGDLMSLRERVAELWHTLRDRRPVLGS